MYDRLTRRKARFFYLCLPLRAKPLPSTPIHNLFINLTFRFW
nr:MAG TPA: hypothetical protein [Caudoviricetes sp.]